MPAVELLSKEGLGGQDGSNSTPGSLKPLGVTCGSQWPPQAAAALSPALRRREKAKPRVQHHTGPSWPCSNSVTVTVPPDQFLLLTNLASALTHSCLSQGGKTGFSCSGSRLLPPWKGKGFREATGQGTWKRAELAVCSF